MGITAHVRRYSPRLWFLFKFHRYCRLKGEREIRVLRDIVPPGRMAIDVGSSIGLYSRALSRLVPRVVAFEANPAVAAFARMVAPNNVEVINVALSAAAGSPVLRIPVNARGRAVEDLATVEAKTSSPAKSQRSMLSRNGWTITATPIADSSRLMWKGTRNRCSKAPEVSSRPSARS